MYLEELLDDVEPLDEAVAALEDEVLLEVPRLGLLGGLEVARQLRLELPEGRAVPAEHPERDEHLLQRLFHFDLGGKERLVGADLDIRQLTWNKEAGSKYFLATSMRRLHCSCMRTMILAGEL